MTDVAAFDHYRVEGVGGVPPGVYRVVGVDGDRATLLRLTDGAGSRVHDGTVERVRVADLDPSFRPAENPDAGFHPVRAVAGMLDGLRWKLRSILGP